jgi:alpha-L-fucosidase
MNKKLLLFLCLISGLTINSQQLFSQPFKATWESLNSHMMPQWCLDSKLGLSLNWGVNAVPDWVPGESGTSNAGWYGKRMHEIENHTFKYNHYRESSYVDFIPKWKAGSFNPKGDVLPTASSYALA